MFSFLTIISKLWKGVLKLVSCSENPNEKIKNDEIAIFKTGGQMYVLYKNDSIRDNLKIVKKVVAKPFKLKEIRNVGGFTLCEINRVLK